MPKYWWQFHQPLLVKAACINTIHDDGIPCKSFTLIHWGRVMHICVSKRAIIVSDNGLLPGRRQAIIWTNAGILLIGPLGTNFSEILIEIHTFSFKKMHFKMSSGKWWPFSLSLNVLMFLSLKNIHQSNVPATDKINNEDDGWYPCCQLRQVAETAS